MTAFDVLFRLSLVLGAGWCSGLNLYATVGMLGLMHRYLPGFALPPGLDALGSHWVIWPALAMYCVEFVADKIPAVDSAWDMVHTFLRVPAGAVLAAMALGDVPLEIQLCAALVGGGLALGAHTTKATTRVVAHASGTSPIVSPAASVVEDGLVIATMALIAAHPILALVFVGLMIVGAVVVVRMFWTLARKAFRALFRLRRRAVPVAEAEAGEMRGA